MRKVRRSAITLLLAMALGAGLAAPAGADGLDDIVGSWVGIDADESYWHMAFSASGKWNGIDSATIPCEGYRSHTWGDLLENDGTYYLFSLNVRCLAGPNKHSEFAFNWELFYDPDTDTLLQPGFGEFREVIFCRRPCDPYDYVP